MMKIYTSPQVKKSFRLIHDESRLGDHFTIALVLIIILLASAQLLFGGKGLNRISELNQLISAQSAQIERIERQIPDLERQLDYLSALSFTEGRLRYNYRMIRAGEVFVDYDF